MWFIGVKVKKETSATPPKKNPGSPPATSDIGTPKLRAGFLGYRVTT